jgi:acetone carboxylase gamma subunit
MTVKVRTVACTALLLLFSGISVFASNTPLRLLIKPVSDRVQSIRFQTGVDETDIWTEVSASNTTLVLDTFDSNKDRLFVQQSQDNQVWSSSYEYQYDSSTKSWKITPLRVVIKPVSNRIQSIRFQTGADETDIWTEVSASNTTLVLETFDSNKDRLFVQQSQDNQVWSSSYEYRYSPSDKRWTVTPTEADSSSLVESLDLKLYNLYPLSKSSTYYSYVIGAGLKMNMALNKQETLLGYAEAAYSRGPSKSDWVDTMQAVNLSVGIGYRFAITDKLQLTPELGYGVVLHLLNTDFDQDGTKTFEPFVDQQIRLSLNLGYELNDSYTLLIAPLGVVFFEKNTIGTLLGIQTSLRFNF